MGKLSNHLRFGASAGKLFALAAASLLLGACVVSQPYYPQQPQEYSAPPAYAEPQGGGYDPQDGADDAQIEARATVAPPPLPEYEQPPCPQPGYLWTPGYWAWGSAGYFWVPGTWVEPPQVGLYWTPGYWAWTGAIFLFHGGYWGPHVGFYGGVHYGGGYDGQGYVGGRWVGRDFAYNRAVTNVNVTIVHNTYNETVINNNVMVNRVSYAGGPNGIRAQMTPQQRMAAHDPHVGRTPMQVMQVRDASANRSLQLQVNQGRPPIAATPRPGAFDAPNVVRARGGRMQPEAPRGTPDGRPAVPPPARSYGRPAAPDSTAPAMRGNDAVRAPAPQIQRQQGYSGAQPQAARPRLGYPPQRPAQAKPKKAERPQAPADHKKRESDRNKTNR